MQIICSMEPNHGLGTSPTNEALSIAARNWDLEESLPDENSESSICCFNRIIREISTVVWQNINVWTYTSSTRVKRELNTTEITKEDRPALITIVRKWRSLAERKKVQNNLLFSNIFYQKLPRPFYRKCSNVFKNSSAICGVMNLEFQQLGFKQKNCNAKVYVCYFDEEDGKKKIEAIAMVTLHPRRPTKPSFLYIDYLASHPKNLISPINVCEHQVGGAGAKLLNHLTKEICPQTNMEQIRLHTTKNAVSFYEKFGFKKASKCMKLKLKPPVEIIQICC